MVKTCRLIAVTFATGLFGAGSAGAQSATDTVSYLRSKLVTPYTIWDDVRSDGSTLTMVMHRDDRDTRVRTYRQYVFDVGKLGPLDYDTAVRSLEYSVDFTMNCDPSWGKCATWITCLTYADGVCQMKSSYISDLVPVNVKALADEDKHRVIKAFMHLNEVYPLKRSVEMFDGQQEKRQ